MKKIYLLFFLPLLACNQKVTPGKSGEVARMNFSKELTTIAFGSCNNQSKAQDMWQYIEANNPDLWIWLGDNIYGDTEDMEVMLNKYKLQRSHPEYQQFIAKCPVLGIWDDHDYGENDAGKNYAKKAESKKLMLDFLEVPVDAEVRKQVHGAHQSYTFGPQGKQVKVILLDARYFRDDLVKDNVANRRYKANESGDILGEVQWQWLEKELRESTAQVHIIGSGIQVIPEDHGWEKWANFPKARKRLFDLMARTKPANPLLISGDRHIAELSKYQPQGLAYPIYELTASGLTHTWGIARPEVNQHRVGEMIVKRNFGLLHINWDNVNPQLLVEVKGLDNKTFLKEELNY